MKSRRDIGSVFPLEEGVKRGSPLPLFENDVVLYANARSAIYSLVRALQPGTVWLPSYLCDVIVEAVGKAGVPHRFYPINFQLQSSDNRLFEEVEARDLVLGIDYFGFPADPRIRQRAHARGAWYLDDACQALLTPGVGDGADFVVYSPRKFLGVPDGGILLLRHTNGIESADLRDELKSAPSDWWEEAYQANLLRRHYDAGKETRNWYSIYQKSEAEGPVDSVAMSPWTESILRKGIDYESIVRRRRENYRVLYEALPKLSVCGPLLEDTVPLGFPIATPNRDAVRERLIEHAIFPPIHWNLEGVVPETFAESRRLSLQIMTLPCDQRYDADDMARIISVLHG